MLHLQAAMEHLQVPLLAEVEDMAPVEDMAVAQLHLQVDMMAGGQADMMVDVQAADTIVEVMVALLVAAMAMAVRGDLLRVRHRMLRQAQILSAYPT